MNRKFDVLNYIEYQKRLIGGAHKMVPMVKENYMRLYTSNPDIKKQIDYYINNYCYWHNINKNNINKNNLPVISYNSLPQLGNINKVILPTIDRPKNINNNNEQNYQRNYPESLKYKGHINKLEPIQNQSNQPQLNKIDIEKLQGEQKDSFLSAKNKETLNEINHNAKLLSGLLNALNNNIQSNNNEYQTI